MTKWKKNPDFIKSTFGVNLSLFEGKSDIPVIDLQQWQGCQFIVLVTTNDIIHVSVTLSDIIHVLVTPSDIIVLVTPNVIINVLVTPNDNIDVFINVTDIFDDSMFLDKTLDIDVYQ